MIIVVTTILEYWIWSTVHAVEVKSEEYDMEDIIDEYTEVSWDTPKILKVTQLALLIAHTNDKSLRTGICDDIYKFIVEEAKVLEAINFIHSF